MATFLIVGWSFCHPTFYVPPPLLVVDLEVSEPGVVFFVVVSVADVAEPQASVDIAVAFVVLVPVSVVVVEVDSSGRPKFLAFPNVDHYASPSRNRGLHQCQE